MNEKTKITMLDESTGQIKEFIGVWNLKETYQLIKNYEKSKNWKIKTIEIGI